jgi:hypothetical protein
VKKVALLLVSLISVSANATIMYVGSNGTDNMYAVDVNTKTGSLIGNAGINFGFGGLGFSNDGTLYGFDSAGGNLYTVDTATGSWTLVGPSGTVAGDSFDIDPTTNTGYVTSFSGLFEVNLGTGLATSVAPSAPFFPASAFAADGTYYIFADPSASELFSLDIATGVATSIGLTGVTESITNLAFNPDDSFLYSVGLSSANLWQFDTATGTGTNLGVIAGLQNDGGQFTMSTFRVTGGNVPVPGVLALLGLGLAMLSLHRGKS